MKVEAVVVRDRVETVMEAVEEETGHVGVTVIEAVGHGREKGITHEYRGRVFESRFLPKALLTFVVRDELVEDVIGAIVDAARTGHVNGDGIVWASPVSHVTHNRTGLKLEEVEQVKQAIPEAQDVKSAPVSEEAAAAVKEAAKEAGSMPAEPTPA